jgi:hypothetical protein
MTLYHPEMEWAIQMRFGTNLYRDGRLTVGASNGEVMLGFYEQGGSDKPVVLDRLTSFQTLEFDDLNPRHVSLVGKCMSRDFLLFNDDTTSDLYVFLTKFIALEHCPGRTRAFMIRPKESQTIPEATSLRAPVRRVSPLPEKTLPEAFTSHLFVETLQDVQPTVLSAGNVRELLPDGVLAQSVALHELEIPEAFRFELWMYILKVGQGDDQMRIFGDLQECWRNITRWQWRLSAALRRFVQRLETDISQREMGDRGRLASVVLMTCMFRSKLDQFAAGLTNSQALPRRVCSSRLRRQ